MARVVTLVLLGSCFTPGQEPPADGGSSGLDAAAGGADAGPDPCRGPEPTWTLEEVDSDTPAFGGISLALDGAGNAHIAYAVVRGEESIIRHATNASGAWQVERVEKDAGRWPSLAIDASGFAHIGFTAPGAGLRYATNASGGWIVETVGEVSADKACVALDPGGAVLLAHERDQNVAVTTNASGTWLTEDVALSFPAADWAELPGQGTRALVVSTAGVPHLLVARSSAIDGDSTSLRVLSWQDGVWDHDVVAYEYGRLHEYRAFLAAAEGGGLHVAYTDPQDRLLYARRGDTGWETSPVDLVGDGEVVGFGVGPSAVGYLSYRTALPSSRLATNACGRWRLHEVGEAGPVGALSPHPDGRVSIAFERRKPAESLWLATSND